MPERYGSDVLAGDWRSGDRKAIRSVVLETGLVLEHAASAFCGAVLGLERGHLRLEDRRGGVRLFPLSDGWLVDGEAVTLIRPAPAAAPPRRTPSGSVAAPATRARVARGSRILVEGRHDAELVERIWGDDLRVEGVVVEYLDGVDHLDAVVRAFAPDRAQRLGVLVDHLVPGSKESRIADAVAAGPYGGAVLVVGHPYVDVWAAVRPARLGLERWPEVPRSVEWKAGVCAALGWPYAGPADAARAWQRILGQVRGYQDLEPALLGQVERLIDFVTAPPAERSATRSGGAVPPRAG
ncbi:MAG: DUF3097 domain-containing protein [Micrococcales bacterium]|nr:DUF3097 domain-containing protein [Micrococcales bacterium]